MKSFLAILALLFALSVYKVYWIDPTGNDDVIKPARETIAPEKLKSLKAGVEKGDRMAQYELGLIYAKGGDIVEQDFVKAHDLLHKAAMQGVPQAMYHLGEMYVVGDGVDENLEKATVWFWLATSLGDKFSEKRLRSMNTRISSTALADAEAEVKRLWKKIPHDLRADAQFMH